MTVLGSGTTSTPTSSAPASAGSTSNSGAPMSAYDIAQAAYAAGFRGSALADITAISLAESGGNPGAVCDSCAGVREYSVGLSQINLDAHPQYSETAMLNPITNLAAAYQVSNGGTDFSPWTTFMDGAYQSNLADAQDAAEQVEVEGGPTDASVAQAGGALEAAWNDIKSVSGDLTLTALSAGALDPLLDSKNSGLSSGIGSAVGNAVGGVVDEAVVGSVEAILDSIPWVPIAEAVLGLAFVIIGLILIAGVKPSQAVSTGTKVAKVAAE